MYLWNFPFGWCAITLNFLSKYFFSTTAAWAKRIKILSGPDGLQFFGCTKSHVFCFSNLKENQKNHRNSLERKFSPWLIDEWLAYCLELLDDIVEVHCWIIVEIMGLQFSTVYRKLRKSFEPFVVASIQLALKIIPFQTSTARELEALIDLTTLNTCRGG